MPPLVTLLKALAFLGRMDLNRRVKKLEAHMSAIDDFRDEINAETSRLGDDIKTVATRLDEAIASGDLNAISQLRPSIDTLHQVGDQLHALAAPPADQPPADQPV